MNEYWDRKSLFYAVFPEIVSFPIIRSYRSWYEFYSCLQSAPLVSVPSGILLTCSTQFGTLRSWIDENPLVGSLPPELDESIAVVGNYLGLSVRISLWDFILILLDRGLQSYVVSNIIDRFRSFGRSFQCIGDEIFDLLWRRFYLSMRCETPSYLLTPSVCVVRSMSHRFE